MTSQRDRVDVIERRLLTTETARRAAVTADNQKLHNDLANLNRDTISNISPADLRSLVTRWMLRLAADQRCPGCDHTVSGHHDDGCRYPVALATEGRGLVCACTVPHGRIGVAA